MAQKEDRPGLPVPSAVSHQRLTVSDRAGILLLLARHVLHQVLLETPVLVGMLLGLRHADSLENQFQTLMMILSQAVDFVLSSLRGKLFKETCCSGKNINVRVR